MMGIDATVLQNIMLAVPFTDWSPLLATEDGRLDFLRWCASDMSAVHMVHDALADAPVFELDNQQDAFVLSVDYADAELLVRHLVVRYEDCRLAALLREDA